MTERKTLIAQVQARDLAAFNQVVERTQGVADAVAYRLLQEEEAAADAVQDAYIKADRGLAAYRGGSFKSWLLRIVTNRCEITGFSMGTVKSRISRGRIRLRDFRLRHQVLAV